MLDASGLDDELALAIIAHDINGKALAESKCREGQNRQADIERMLQGHFENTLVSLGGLLEFALRQLLDFLAVNQVIDSSTVRFAEISSLDALEKTLKGKWVNEDLFSTDDWRDVRLLSKVRNKIVHVMGWHDDIEFEPQGKMILHRYGLIAATGHHPMGLVHRFNLTSETAHRVAALYWRVFASLEVEFRSKLNAHS